MLTLMCCLLLNYDLINTENRRELSVNYWKTAGRFDFVVFK